MKKNIGKSNGLLLLLVFLVLAINCGCKKNTDNDPEPPSIIGKWTLTEGSYNSTMINNITGYIEFVDKEKFSARIDKGTSYASSNSYYTLSGNSFSCIMPSTLILNGTSFTIVGSKNVFTTISMSNSDFTQIGGTAIGYDKTLINYTLSSTKLIIKSSDGKTIITYKK
jgi:hypothetical protein